MAKAEPCQSHFLSLAEKFDGKVLIRMQCQPKACLGNVRISVIWDSVHHAIGTEAPADPK